MLSSKKRPGSPGLRISRASGLLALLASLVWAQTTTAPPPAQNQPAAPAAAPNPAPAPPPLSVLIDPAHGGTETGALLEGTTAEKDVNLSIARRLRSELTLRGLSSELVREADQTLSADQRAARANARRPALYLAIHSSSEGLGLALYSAVLAAAPATRGPFLDWETAQAAALGRSRALEQKLAVTVAKAGFPIRALSARLRPLNNVTVPALAVELSPTRGDSSQLSSANYQQMVASELANALNSLAPYLKAGPDSSP